ncbi:hypothetical protein BV25DRAFT_1835151 [Artomyces pyxidatus]|uniref:Uncharacterized protein n=1 Tax=Artomyces pyxidatus TaxID=48021 RepID=A0ACB8TGH5_9AGAM|nr:hypothetical protein BV25DRAFT_1835151 [Artomyces pyxidatus]
MTCDGCMGQLVPKRHLYFSRITRTAFPWRARMTMQGHLDVKDACCGTHGALFRSNLANLTGKNVADPEPRNLAMHSKADEAWATAVTTLLSSPSRDESFAPTRAHNRPQRAKDADGYRGAKSGRRLRESFQTAWVLVNKASEEVIAAKQQDHYDKRGRHPLIGHSFSDAHPLRQLPVLLTLDHGEIAQERDAPGVMQHLTF